MLFCRDWRNSRSRRRGRNLRLFMLCDSLGLTFAIETPIVQDTHGHPAHRWLCLARNIWLSIQWMPSETIPSDGRHDFLNQALRPVFMSPRRWSSPILQIVLFGFSFSFVLFSNLKLVAIFDPELARVSHSDETVADVASCVATSGACDKAQMESGVGSRKRSNDPSSTDLNFCHHRG